MISQFDVAVAAASHARSHCSSLWTSNIKQIGNLKHTREFKIWRQQRQRQRQKSTIQLIEWGKNNRAARAARFLVQFFDIVYQTTTWNVLIWASDDNASLQR